MKIRVKKTQNGSPDGIRCVCYERGLEYDMPDSLGQVFIDEKWGTRVKEKEAPKEQKPLDPKSVPSPDGNQ